MKGWILYKHSQKDVRPEAYEIGRFLAVAHECGMDIRVIKPEDVDLIVTREDRKSMRLDGQIVDLPAFLLPRMGSTTTYFALSVIRHLERLGVHSFNSAQSVDTVKDKLFTQQILAQQNLPVPKTMLVKFPVDVELVDKNLGFPVVVKTLTGTQGMGVFLSENKQSFEDLMQLMETTEKSGKKVNIILQEYIKSSHGRDLRVFVIGGRAVACMERKAIDGNFKANFSRGAQVTKFKMTHEISWLSTETARIMGLEIAGIDLLFDGDHFKICEANSSPGFHGLEKCCNIDIAKEIYRFVKIRLGIF